MIIAPWYGSDDAVAGTAVAVAIGGGASGVVALGSPYGGASGREPCGVVALWELLWRIIRRGAMWSSCTEGALVEDLQEGNHVEDLPDFEGGSVIVLDLHLM